MNTGIARHIVQPFLDFLFPPLCLACGGRLGSGESFLCAVCRAALEPASDSDRTMRVLTERFAGSGAVAAFFPLYFFEEHGVLQHVIHALKYGGMSSLGEAFGGDLGARLHSDPRFSGIDMIIPVPLHTQKERERGYNQSLWICRGIAHALPAPIENRILFRNKNTRTQTKLTASERIENVCGAFAVEPSRRPTLRKKNILLVDDVVTTGATVLSCAEALRSAGAGSVLCASIGAAKLD